MESKPREYWPEDESPEEEHEKYFHTLSITHIFHPGKGFSDNFID